VFYYSNGEKYDGEWDNGKISGKGNVENLKLGRFYFHNGEKYDGEWSDNKENGKGKFEL